MAANTIAAFYTKSCRIRRFVSSTITEADMMSMSPFCEHSLYLLSQSPFGVFHFEIPASHSKVGSLSMKKLCSVIKKLNFWN